MPQRSASHDQENDSSDFPPVIACATCGRPSCEGCASALPAAASGAPCPLPWEGQRGGVRAFVKTALLSVEQPELTFASASSMTLGRAFSFALLCETFALSSFGFAGLAWGYFMMPRWITQLLLTPYFWPTAGAILLILVAGMLVVHLAWGALLERGIKAQQLPTERKQGLCFGLYACGWDFITSPLGVVCALLFRGRRAGSSLLAALRVPTHAMRHYLSGRGLDESERQLALRHLTRGFLRGSLVLLAVLLSAGVGGLLSVWP